MIDYFRHSKEPVLEWLMKYQPGDAVTFRDFMSGRVGYYPGSGSDGCLMKVGNQSHSVHCFLYVDYLIAQEELEQEIPGIKGYHSIGRVEYGL
jgi:hypothetical protein